MCAGMLVLGLGFELMIMALNALALAEITRPNYGIWCVINKVSSVSWR